MNRRNFLASSASLAALAAAPSPTLAQVQGEARAWEIGPVIRGRNYSVNMPLHPEAAAGGGWSFAFPGPARDNGHVHYVTRATGPLDRARGIRLRYRIDARPGTRFVPQEYPDRPPMLSLFVQRRGDDWAARGGTRFHRWYSPDARVMPLTPRTHEQVLLFSENWISVMGSDHARSPREFAAALAEAGRIGLTFGTNGGRGHGIYATAPARFTLLEFEVI